MYVSRHHRQPDLGASHALIDAHPLGAWVVPAADGLVANHLPFLLDRSRGPFGTLLGHVSRANPVWRQLDASAPSVVLFQGPQAYITPGWYPGKAEHGQVVPTWNYAVAHAHGIARAIDDEAWLLDLLARLTAANEAGQPVPWQTTDAPEAFIRKLARAVVGIEIPIDRLEGKLKASQDEALPDRQGTVQGLAAVGSENASAMARLVQQALQSGSAAD
ncbi:FMN-binding negative transcriptional regulator [Variovorax sp. EBFNA2]|uniref:FMN-binding negative transcriptional regulator n=1 Tax=Variovorax sp. EBFNA2 TaxID=3342097 RepID=UPI0029C0B074|nr:FMN-binding negative transcriptional regulator [Variovorax boronicumulans]WPG36037.1 FMN-binding negative transcriptional regulator [Variovorax boronicumulans]